MNVYRITVNYIDTYKSPYAVTCYYLAMCFDDAIAFAGSKFNPDHDPSTFAGIASAELITEEVTMVGETTFTALKDSEKPDVPPDYKEFVRDMCDFVRSRPEWFGDLAETSSETRG